ncbi:PadR family transcriptional regulator [Luteimicrobium sp. NPDC057192]|uniref:PadR family transcriptional regulator n=1 Tax=Luteimicrobium sp. NPDC057192 TaxID=3346042 RepID=UPI0036265530
MPGSLLKNPVIVSVLGLLVERPLHLYALSHELDRRLDAQGLPLGRGSLRNVLTALVEAGWVGVDERETPTGTRSVFATTEAGVRELRDRVERQIADPRADHDHMAQAVAYLGLLDPADAADLLRRRAAEVRAIIEAIRAGIDAAGAADLPELYVVEGGYALALRTAEATWLEETALRIQAGELAWPAS